MQSIKVEKREVRSADVYRSYEGTYGAKEAFNRLKQAFIEAPILQHFDLKSHIRIKTDASGYAIGRVFSQLSTD